MAILKIGDLIPDIRLPSSQGADLSPRDFQGKKQVVLYFYPKDDTPGCTTEACELRDHYQAIIKTGAVILGVSPDGLDRHAKFITKHDLPFILLSDAEHLLCKACGVWVKKSMYGKEYMGVARTTFLIGQDGKVARVFEKVKPAGHAQEVLAAMKKLTAADS